MKREVVFLCALVGVVAALAACMPEQTAEPSDGTVSGQEVSAAELPIWNEGSDCSSCHAAEVASGTDSACTYSLHTSVACITCHVNTDGKLAAAHEEYATAKLPTRLKKTKVANDACLTACHSVEELQISTASSSVLTDANGKVVNPHDLPATEYHLDNATCSDCHKMHLLTPADEVSSSLCLGCHHQDVYECGTCHE